MCQFSHYLITLSYFINFRRLSKLFPPSHTSLCTHVFALSTHPINLPALHTRSTHLTPVLTHACHIRKYTFQFNRRLWPSCHFVIEGSRHGWGFSPRTKLIAKQEAAPSWQGTIIDLRQRPLRLLRVEQSGGTIRIPSFICI